MAQSAGDLLIGIDGGGSKTVCWLAAASPGGGTDAAGGAEPLGRGLAGPANPQSVGWEAAVRELGRAVAAAFADAGMSQSAAAAACIGLAGGDRDSVREPLGRWAAECGLAARFLATHDALPILAAGTPGGHGIALISGTGSFAFGRAASGRTARAGGWGYLFGDEGSGYAIAVAALRAVAQAADGRGPATALTGRLLHELQAAEPARLIEAVYGGGADRHLLAGLAPAVLETADRDDAVARQLVDAAATDLACQVDAVVQSLGIDRHSFALALGGGLLVNSERLRTTVQAHLSERRLTPGSVQLVPESVAGAIRLARELLTAGD
jgi:N-acetylglucosamine kinase-like BadF-type ATPase